jgi:hypothetical protein
VLGSDRPEDRIDLGGLETAWAISSARSYPYSISPSEGARLRVAWLREAEGRSAATSPSTSSPWTPGSTGASSASATSSPCAPGAGRRGERSSSSRSFAVGGYPDASLFDIVRTNNAVLRGYPDNAFTGRRYAAFNAEYRFPLFSPQRGWRSLPLFLRHFRGGVFFDAAHAWSEASGSEDVKTSAGVSLGLDSAIGFALPLSAEVTVARGFAARATRRCTSGFGLAF